MREQDQRDRRRLLGCGISLTVVFFVVALLAERFDEATPVAQRPIGLTVALLMFAGLPYLAACILVRRMCRRDAGESGNYGDGSEASDDDGHLPGNTATAATRQRIFETQVFGTVLVFAFVFRAVVVFSTPIQEIDIFRYIWDGYVTLSGVSAYRYSPAEVKRALTARPGNSEAEPDLEAAASLCRQFPVLRPILERVHYSELTTVYPPTSQAVFAAAAATTPPSFRMIPPLPAEPERVGAAADSPPLTERSRARGPADVVAMRAAVSRAVRRQVVWFKLWLMLFDVGAIFWIARLLRRCGRPTALCAAYAWCPLVIKEFANSGHLDAIAVFFTAMAVDWTLRCGDDGAGQGSANSRSKQNKSDADSVANRPGVSENGGVRTLLVTGMLWAAAIGAKLYPAVLLPVVGVWLGRRSRTAAAIVISVATIGSGVVLSPMLIPVLRAGGSAADESPSVNSSVATSDGLSPQAVGPDRQLESRKDRGGAADDGPSAVAERFAGFGDEPPPAPIAGAVRAVEAVSASDSAPEPSRAPAGISAFFARWEMNDFLFLLVEENLRPTDSAASGAGRRAWFAIVPNAVRRKIDAVAGAFGIAPQLRAFAAARAITTVAFLCVVAWGCRALLRTVAEDVSIGVRREAADGNCDGDRRTEPLSNAISQPLRFCRAAFFVLAWLWLLTPTQNPWYWTWAVAFLPFVERRCWYVLGTLAFLYYLRFAFVSRFPQAGVFGTAYDGAAFFDFVFVWFEYAPWFLWLAWTYRPERFRGVAVSENASDCRIGAGETAAELPGHK